MENNNNNKRGRTGYEKHINTEQPVTFIHHNRDIQCLCSGTESTGIPLGITNRDRISLVQLEEWDFKKKKNNKKKGNLL